MPEPTTTKGPSVPQQSIFGGPSPTGSPGQTILPRVINFGDSRRPGDVEINVLEDVYRLHSAVLCNASTFFDASMAPEWWDSENTHNGEDGVKYRYRFEPETEGGVVGIFQRVTVGYLDVFRVEKRRDRLTRR